MKRVSRVLLSSMLLGTVLLIAVRPESTLAVTCSGSGCNGKSPQTTGCAADGTTLRSNTIRDSDTGAAIGRVELRSSAVCKTRWSRTTSYIGATLITQKVERADGLEYIEQDSGATQAFSMMVYVGTSQTARACGNINGNQGIACTGYQ